MSLCLTLSDGAKHQDARLLDDPVRMEQQAFKQRQEVWKQLLTKHVGQNVQSRSRAFSWELETDGRDYRHTDRRKTSAVHFTVIHHVLLIYTIKSNKINGNI